MQVIFIIIIFYCTRGYNSLGDLTRQHKVWRKTLTSWSDRKADCMRLGGEHKIKLNYSTYQTQFDVKMTKMKWNYTANMIMSVSGTVCHLILYFPVNLGLAINLRWPAVKNKQRICFELFDIISWSVFYFFYYLFLLLTMYTYKLLK